MRNFTVIDAPQRSPEWFQARLGRLTGSRASDMLAMHKDGKTPSTSRRNLRVQLALERVTGRSQEDPFLSGDLKRGEDLEPDARARYEAATGVLLRETGFITHTELMAG